MRKPKGSGETPTIDPEALLFDHLRTLLGLQKWAEARSTARELATLCPQNAHYRALLALARGHEAEAAGDHKRAREEWQRALALEPKLEAASLALRRRRRTSLLGWLLRR